MVPFEIVFQVHSLPISQSLLYKKVGEKNFTGLGPISQS